MTDRLRHWLLVAASAYLVLVPVGALTAFRSIAFAASSVFALGVLAAAAAGRSARVLPPGRAVPLAIATWMAWGIASLLWSVDPAFTAGELRREVAWSVFTIITFYVAGADARSFRILVTVALVTFAVAALEALGSALTPDGWDPGRWNADAGTYSTYVVLIAPLLLTLLAPAPAGFANGWQSRITGLALFALLLATARLTENRMVWVALAAVFATASALAALRWRATLVRAPLRWLVPLLAVLVVLGALFVDVARERAILHFPPHTSVGQTLARDPRLALWDYTAERIGERPLTGYGFGKSILQTDLRSALHDPLLSHAHNVFMSQWLQLGAVGLAAFLAMLAALAWRFARFLRSADDRLAFVGLIGLSVLAGFVLKNLTDDFFIRSNAKEFWALSAMLLGFGVRLESAAAPTAATRAAAPPREVSVESAPARNA
jgi:O-antigen ligase